MFGEQTFAQLRTRLTVTRGLFGLVARQRQPGPLVLHSKHWFTTSFLGGRCRKAMLGVYWDTRHCFCTASPANRHSPNPVSKFKMISKPETEWSLERLSRTNRINWKIIGGGGGGGVGGGGRGNEVVCFWSRSTCWTRPISRRLLSLSFKLTVGSCSLLCFENCGERNAFVFVLWN